MIRKPLTNRQLCGRIQRTTVKFFKTPTYG